MAALQGPLLVDFDLFKKTICAMKGGRNLCEDGIHSLDKLFLAQHHCRSFLFYFILFLPHMIPSPQ